MQELVRRYHAAFGPASVADVAQLAMLTRPVARAAAPGLAAHETEDGTVLYDVPDGQVPTGDETAPPRLLPMWDSMLLASSDRSRVIPQQHRVHVTRRNGDTLPTLLIDGRIAGVWPAVDGRMECTAFAPLDDAAWSVWRRRPLRWCASWRHASPRSTSATHWSATLPSAQVRVLG